MAKSKSWVGSRIRVVVPEVVVRVGYPRSMDDYYQQALTRYGLRLAETLPDILGYDLATKIRGADPSTCLEIAKSNPLFSRMLWTIAYPLARKDQFGGNARTIHTVRMPEIEGREFTVLDRRSAYTGMRYGGHRPSSWFNDDGEPPSLEHVQHHNILMIQSGTHPTLRPNTAFKYTDNVWIDALNVVKIEPSVP